MTPWVCWRDPRHVDVMITRFGWPQCRVCAAAPAYHERGKWMSSDLTVPVFVPAPEAPMRHVVAPGSAVVGCSAGGFAEVTYEGWVYGAHQYAHLDTRGRYEAAVLHAADRLVTDYPTRARMVVAEDELVHVGDYNPTTRVLDVTDQDALTHWLEAWRDE